MSKDRSLPSQEGSGRAPAPSGPAYVPSLEQDTERMFSNLGRALSGELMITNEDYKVLAQMNEMTASQYRAMAASATELADSMELIQKNYERLTPYLSQISSIENSVMELEATVIELDRYTSALDERLSKLKSDR